MKRSQTEKRPYVLGSVTPGTVLGADEFAFAEDLAVKTDGASVEVSVCVEVQEGYSEAMLEKVYQDGYEENVILQNDGGALTDGAGANFGDRETKARPFNFRFTAPVRVVKLLVVAVDN